MINENRFQIITSFANLRNDFSNYKNLETQLLHGEHICILDTHKNWSLVCSEDDGYQGWIETKNIGEIKKKTLKISQAFAFVFTKPDIKSSVIGKLYLNSKVEIKNSNTEWYEINYLNTKGFINKKSGKSINSNLKNWIKISSIFMNVPYLWGGKTFGGIDCSGLVQLSLQFCGINIPRNTKEQIDFESKNIRNTDEVSKGCLIFWPGHVAISVNKEYLIHSNIYHLCTKKEKIKIAEKRIGNIIKIKKVLFN